MNDGFKIGIMAQCGSIMPAIYGGAAENLLTMIIDENERQPGIRHRSLLKLMATHEICGYM